MTSQQRKDRLRIAALCFLLGAAQVAAAQSAAQHEVLLFPALGGLDTWNESDASVKQNKSTASVDLVYSYSGEHFRFLAEYLWSTDEAELERVKAGWSLANTTMLWFGRFHSPARYWMSAFHHGQYMQTSITRPSLEAWEDDSGSTPSHITGVMLELGRDLKDQASLEYVMSAGLAPKFVGSELVPHDPLDPRSGHGLSLNARAGYRPEVFGTSSVGLLLSWNEINVPPLAVPASPDLFRVDQLTAGFYVDWEWDRLRLISSFIYYDNKLRSTDGNLEDDFTLGYLQPEYTLNKKLTVFGRVDTGIDEDNSVYLRMLPEFASHRNMLGLRWDFADFQALTLEVADTSKQGDDDSHLHFKEIRLQWSAALP